jgi:hypothetical protein
VGNKFNENSPTLPKRKFAIKNPLPILLNPDIDLMLAYNGIVNGLFYTVITSISTLFLDIYPFLNETTVGLCFLPLGGGMAIGSVLVGRLMDWDYKRMKRQVQSKTGNDMLGEIGDFPIEKVRSIQFLFLSFLIPLVCNIFPLTLAF